jgi:hypothetical protein
MLSHCPGNLAVARLLLIAQRLLLIYRLIARQQRLPERLLDALPVSLLNLGRPVRRHHPLVTDLARLGIEGIHGPLQPRIGVRRGRAQLLHEHVESRWRIAIRRRVRGQRPRLADDGRHQIRGLLGEFGLAIPQGIYRKLEAIPGIGPLAASALVASIAYAHSFDNGRQVSAWLGLVPRQSSSGGRPTLLGMSKRVDAYLRTLLIHGARSAILAAKNKVDNTQGWLTNLLKRRHPNIAAVALANKNVRTVWALLAHGREFRADYMPTRMAA